MKTLTILLKKILILLQFIILLFLRYLLPITTLFSERKLIILLRSEELTAQSQSKQRIYFPADFLIP